MVSTKSKKGNSRRAVFAILVIACLWLLAWFGARFLIVRAPLEHADAIVVLSGSSTLVERTQYAARLYNNNRSRRILLTTDNQQGGWSPALQRNPYSYERATQELIRQGVPAENIQLIQPSIDSTWDEAKLINKYATTHNLRSILIVTSAYHSRRALWTFRKTFNTGAIQIGLEPVETGIQTPSPATWWLYPGGWQFILAEYLKLFYYMFRSENSNLGFWYGGRIETLATWRQVIDS